MLHLIPIRGMDPARDLSDRIRQVVRPAMLFLNLPCSHKTPFATKHALS